MITLEHVTKIYPDGTRAVNDISFTVEKGELCVLLGPSGCGKTTTMKMINRLIPMTDGKILLNGEDITRMDENELRKQIGYAIQEIGLFPHMTVGENIGVVPELRGWSRDKRRKQAGKLLEMVKMDPDKFMDRYPSELSGGQRQRVGVARALGADPAVLLMDEPFGAIDPITRVDLQNEFLKIQQDIRKTIVFVTHDIYEAIKMGDKIALMNRGELIQYEIPFNMLFQPKDKFVADFVGKDRALKGLQLIRIKDVMQKSPTVAKAEDNLEGLRKQVQQENIHHEIPVVDENDRFIGWIEPENLKGDIVKDAITEKAATASGNMVLDEALSLMLSGRQKALAVLDKSDRLQGILTFGDIQRALGAEEDSGEAK